RARRGPRTTARRCAPAPGSLRQQDTWSANVAKNVWRGNRRAPTRRLVRRLDAGVLDHLAPALFLLAEVTVELGWRARDQDQALVHAELFEGLCLHRVGGRLVEAVDDPRRRLGRRKQAVPGFGVIAGHAGLGDRGQIWEGRRAFRRSHRQRAQLPSL